MSEVELVSDGTVRITYSSFTPDAEFVVCDLCSALVLDADQHSDYHASVLHAGVTSVFAPFMVPPEAGGPEQSVKMVEEAVTE